MATLTTMPAPTTPKITKRRFSVKEYYLMAEAGILSPHDRVELIDGEIVQMAPIGSYHAACVDTLTRLFMETLGRRVIVRVQGPVRLSERSEPEPDIALLRPRADAYRGLCSTFRVGYNTTMGHLCGANCKRKTGQPCRTCGHSGRARVVVLDERGKPIDPPNKRYRQAPP